jgi:uncharacterized protein (TIGR03437 family)
MQLPLVFEANRGQTDPGVRFLARGSGYSLLLRDDGAVLRLPSSELRMRLAGSQRARAIEALDPQPGTSNYFLSNDAAKWHTGIPQSGRVQYRQVYKGIDLVFKSATSNRFEYDFVVAPGADPSKIGVRFEGAQSIESDGDGGVVLHTSSGEIRQPRPRIYQELESGRREVAGRMTLGKGNIIRFGLGDYDHTRTLIIDPVVFQFLVGSTDDRFGSIARDSAGYVYVTGYTASQDFPKTQLFGTPGEPAFHVFVTKLSADLQTVYYSAIIGGNQTDWGYGIQVDGAGSAYVVGTTTSSNFPTVHAAQANYGNKRVAQPSSAFILKLDPKGDALVYSTFLGGEGVDGGTAISIDGTGAAYATGSATSPDFPVTPGAIHLGPKLVVSGSTGIYQNSVWVAKLSPDGGTFDYVAIYGGSQEAIPTSIAVDSQGNAYAAGEVATIGPSDFPIVGNVVQPTRLGSNGCTNCANGFVSKLNPSGAAFVFSTYFGGSKSDFINGLALDDAGNIYIVGNTSSPDLPVTAGVLGPTFIASSNAFVAALDNSASTVLACSYLGGTTAANANAILVRAPGVIGIVGGATNDFVGFPLVKNRIGGVYIEVDPLFQKVINTYAPAAFSAAYTAAAAAPDGSVAMGSSTQIIFAASGLEVSSSRYDVILLVDPAPQAAPPPVVPTIGSVVSATSFGGFAAVAPGSFIEIYGLNLAPDTRGWTKADFTGNQAPTSLDGVEVSIAGQNAFVNYIVANPGQVNVQLPSNIPTGPQQITVTNKLGTSAPFNVTVNATEPGLLAPASFQVGGKQYVVAFLSDNVTYVLPAGAIAGLPSRPAKPGETIVMYGNGFGPVTPDIPGGQLVTQNNQLTLPLEVMFGDKPAQLAYFGLSPGLVGVYQFDVVVPAIPNNDLVPLSFKLGGVAGTQTLYTAVHQ